MATINYKGNTYFKVNGNWKDCQSRSVESELIPELDALYEKTQAKEKERSKKKKPEKYFDENYLSQKRAYGGVIRKSPIKKNHEPQKASAKAYKKAELSADQKAALAILESGENVFLSGEAGTGKSFVLNEFIYKNKNKNIIVCAPTGIAAINVGGSTLHRVFKAPIRVSRPGEFTMKPDEAVVKADVIIIDEISMCRLDLFEYVIRTIRQAEKIQQKKANLDAINHDRMPELLGPKQIIVVGDFYQLAPVVTSTDKELLYQEWGQDVFKDGFAFQSKLWQELDFKSALLQEPIRQKGDSEFIENLNKIRVGNREGVYWFNKHVDKEPIPNSIYLCGTNRAADAVNQEASDALSGEYVIYTAQVKGEVKNSDKMTKDELALKVGMQVMTLVNDKEEGYQNGSIGEIIALNQNKVRVRLNTGAEVDIKPYDWEILGYEIIDEKLEKIVLGNFKQIPLKTAYAITIHKSQGQTYSSANISPDCFADGQLYVALSRTETIEGMSLEHNIEYRSLRTSREVKEFYEKLQ